MAFGLWGLWLFNCIYMVIILLNFLISIVSKAHDEAIQIQEQTIFEQKCELNYEYDTIKKFLHFGDGEKEGDLFVIAANFKESHDGHELMQDQKNAIDNIEQDLREGFKKMNK